MPYIMKSSVIRGSRSSVGNRSSTPVLQVSAAGEELKDRNNSNGSVSPIFRGTQRSSNFPSFVETSSHKRLRCNPTVEAKSLHPPDSPCMKEYY